MLSLCRRGDGDFEVVWVFRCQKESIEVQRGDLNCKSASLLLALISSLAKLFRLCISSSAYLIAQSFVLLDQEVVARSPTDRETLYPEQQHFDLADQCLMGRISHFSSAIYLE